MAGARDHRHEHDENAPTSITRRAADPGHAPAIAGPGDPRLVHGGAGAGLMQLQQTAGNAAVASMVAPAVQRAVEIEELSTSVDAGDGASPDAGAGATSAGPVSSDGGSTTISGSAIHLDAPMVHAPGVVRVGTIIADNVVGSNYTPGAGNMW